MKSNLSHLDRYMFRRGNDGAAYLIPHLGRKLRVIATTGGGWDHVSVSLPKMCPTWEDMEYIKRQFFEPHEAAMQLHPPQANYVNIHPHCLHIWRPQGRTIPMPPVELV